MILIFKNLDTFAHDKELERTFKLILSNSLRYIQQRKLRLSPFE